MAGTVPLADFACLGKKCRQEDGSAAVYELPITATRCAVCASKRIQRLFNKVGVLIPREAEGRWGLVANGSSSIAKRIDSVLEPAYEAAHAEKNRAKDARTNGRVSPALAVPIRNGQIAFAESQAVKQFPQLSTLPVGSMPGGSRPTGQPGAPLVANRTPLPGPGTLRDHQHKIVTRGGRAVAEKV